MAEEEVELTLPKVVQQISDSLCSSIPEIVLLLKSYQSKNNRPEPAVLRSIEGVAKAGDTLAQTCTDIANEEYQDFAEIQQDILSSATLVTKSSVKLRRAGIHLNQPTDDYSSAYGDVMEAATSIAGTCVHVLEVVYGSYIRRCVLVYDDTYTAFQDNSAVADGADKDAQHYADTLGDLCSKANILAYSLDALGENERDENMGRKLTAMGKLVEEKSQACLDAGNDYLGALGVKEKRDAAQNAQDELMKIIHEAGELIAAAKKEHEQSKGAAPAPEPEPQPEPEPVPERASLASKTPEMTLPLTYLTLVKEQKVQCDLVDDLVATAKGGMRQAMVENARAIVKRHSIITQEAERLCECDMARDAVNDTAEKSDVAIRTLVKNGSGTLDNTEDEEVKKTLEASASEYKVLLMKYSDDCMLKPLEARTQTACQRLRVAITEMHSAGEVLPLLEEAVGEYNYRVERVDDDDLKEELQDDVHVIEIDVRAFAAKNGMNAEEERDIALDSMDRFENAMIAYLLSLVEAALLTTSKLFESISKKDDKALDACSGPVLSSVTEVISQSHNISEEYTGCVEGTQDEFQAASKRVDEALTEMMKAARAVKGGKCKPEDTKAQQKELEDSLHHVEELCRRAQYKRVPKKHEPEEEKPPKEEESVLVERKKPEEKVEKEEKTETAVEKKKEEPAAKEGGNTNLYLIGFIVILVLIILKLISK